MPSESKAQARLMEGIAHGSIPPKGGLTKEKAEEWAEADEEKGTKGLPNRKKKKAKKKLHKSFAELKKAVETLSEDWYPKWEKLEAHPDYYYHATSEDNAEGIANSGHLKPHGPSYGTNQGTWPDGSTKKRSYFTDKPSVARHFAPENGRPALLRVKRDDAAISSEKGTGDYITHDKIPAAKIERLHGDAWVPLKKLTKALAPGQPAPPKPTKKRAPRPESPFDPLEGVHHSSAPYQFRPHRLKDLWALHKLDAYEPASVKKVKIRGYVARMKQSLSMPSFPKMASFSVLKSFIEELKCTD